MKTVVCFCPACHVLGEYKVDDEGMLECHKCGALTNASTDFSRERLEEPEAYSDT